MDLVINDSHSTPAPFAIRRGYTNRRLPNSLRLIQRDAVNVVNMVALLKCWAVKVVFRLNESCNALKRDTHEVGPQRDSGLHHGKVVAAAPSLRLEMVKQLSVPGRLCACLKEKRKSSRTHVRPTTRLNVIIWRRQN